MKCSNCGRDIDESVFPPPLTYCPYCGFKQKASVEEAVRFCPHCGKPLPSRVNLCPYCGKEITVKPGATYSAKPAAIEPAELKVKPAATYYAKPEAAEIEPRVEHKPKPVVEPPPEPGRKSAKLYKQWVKYASLPPEAIPVTESKESPVHKLVKRGTGGNRLPLLQILLVICVGLVIMGIFFILQQTC